MSTDPIDLLRVGQPTHILAPLDSPARARHSVCGVLWINDSNRDRFVEPAKASCRLCRRGKYRRPT